MSPIRYLGRFLTRFTKDESSGCWVWSSAINHNGYGEFYAGKMVRAHRFAYESLVGPIPHGKQIDHICHNRACVNPDHLRVCDSGENTRNQKLSVRNTSGFKGVSWAPNANGWKAQIRANRKGYHLGYFPSKEEAHQAYLDAASIMHGEFACSGVV